MDKSNTKIKKWVKDNFKPLCSRIEKAESHVIKTKFIKDVVMIQQKGRRISNHFQERVTKME